MAPRPPLLFSEVWKLPPYTGEQTDENMRVTPAVVTNPNLEVKLYGRDAQVIRAAVHEERFDLWNGMTASPSAVTLRDRVEPKWQREFVSLLSRQALPAKSARA